MLRFRWVREVVDKDPITPSVMYTLVHTLAG